MKMFGCLRSDYSTFKCSLFVHISRILSSMQLLLISDDRKDRLINIHKRLFNCFGHPELCLLLDPVSQLVMGLIGGKTTEMFQPPHFFALNSDFPIGKVFGMHLSPKSGTLSPMLRSLS